MKKLNFSILSAGNIAGAMANTVSQMSEVVPYSIAARDLDRAQNLADKYGFQKAYGSYEELVNDDNVDLIYVASPHSHHYEHAKLCLEHGKNVLCEKSFTANKKQAEELFALAKSKNLFIMEAVWTRFLPFAAKMHEIIDSGAIGAPQTLTASFGQNLTHIERLVAPELAGGSLLDLGIYLLTFASMFLGTEVTEVHSACVKTDRGVDGQESISLIYRNGSMAVLNDSLYTRMENKGIVYGVKGRVEVEDFWCPKEIRVSFNDGSEPKVIPVPFEITGYEYEVRAAVKAIESGKLGCDEMPAEETLRIMGIMDQLRAEWGIRFPFE